MTTIYIKQKIKMHRLDKPYMRGTYVGIILGMGIIKILNNIYLGYKLGILTGFVVFISGLLIWARQYSEDLLQ
jgi:hypothetical protein